MSIWKKLFSRKLEPGIDGPTYSFSGAKKSVAGKNVTEDSALASSAVYACVRILTQSISSLPVHLFRRMNDGSRKRVENSNLEFLINDTPNEMMTAPDFLGAMQFNLLMYNSAYAEIIRNQYGEPIELWPLSPKNLTLEVTGNSYLYRYTSSSNGVSTFIQPNDILAIHGLTKNGLVGLSMIDTAKDTIGTSLAADDMAAAAFLNGSVPAGAIKMPQGCPITEEGMRNLVQGWEKKFSGPVNAGKVSVLYDGLDYVQFDNNIEKFQLLQTRQFQVRDIARIFGIPAHMLADPDKESAGSNEQQALDFVKHTLRPWLVRWERALARSFFTPTQRKGLYFEFSTDSLLKGDIQTRFNAYQIGIQNGWLSADEVRIKENMSPIPGDSGNQYMLPMNMESSTFKMKKEKKTLESPEDAPETPKSLKGNPDTKVMPKRQIDPLQAVYEGVMSSIDEYERTALSNILERCDGDLEKYNKDVIKFAKNSHKYIANRLQPFVDQGFIEDSAVNDRYQANLRSVQSILELTDNQEDKLTKIRQFTESI